ncbi:PLD nuclease N-terminal domain-containing protein [Brevibacterium sp. BDJS002]|uniref:PLD nuclease N-terminal domain-containing protein n=1 Tax=unclassified Brevibacterium TaxID=2614124 RepID=UPI001F2FDF2D|nr:MULTISPECIES: PLD nuclease N-terminal domain-containing protein [unclassified Brevibacterium]MCF2589013.1 PLDc_N domain-containing protein [Brevibacterium sp. UCMA 11752]WCE41138.1 PLD nuclease N-terminal domain-containing protein [Brevibacterium sp. BDJS002]
MSETPLLPAWYDFAWTAVLLVVIGLAIWSLVSLAQSKVDAPTKLAWAVFIIALPILGSLVWLDYRRRSLAQRKHSDELAQ